MHAELARYDNLVHAVHDAALVPERGPAVVARVAEAFSAPRTLLFTLAHTPAQRGFTFTHDISQAALEQWAAKSMHADPYVRSATEKGLPVEGVAVNGDDLVAPGARHETGAGQELHGDVVRAHLRHARDALGDTRRHPGELTAVGRRMFARASILGACAGRAAVGVATVALALVAAGGAQPTTAGVNAWTTTGPLGAVSDIATDPAVDGRAFASTAFGLYRTTDGGRAWSRVDPGPRAGIAFDPADPDVMFASSGTLSLHRSADGGATWTADVPVPSGFDPTFSGRVTIGRIAKAPGPDGALYATFGGSSLLRTVDLGKSWTNLGLASDFAIDADAPSLVYAAVSFVGSNAPVVRRSHDGGTHWEAADQGLPPGFLPYALAIDRRDGGRIYAMGSVDTCNPDSPSLRLFASGDGGTSWQSRGLPEGVGCYARISTDPRQPRRLLLHGRPEGGEAASAWLTDDGGLAWIALALTMGDRVWGTAPGFAANELYVAGAIDGVQWSGNNGTTWMRRNAGLSGAPVTIMSASTDGFTTAVSTLPAIGSAWSVASANYRAGGTGRWLDIGSEPGLPSVPVVLGVERGGASAMALTGINPAMRRARTVAGWDGPWEPLGAVYESPYLRLDRLTNAPSSALHWVASGAGFVGARSNYAYSGLSTSNDGGRTWVNRQVLDRDPITALLPRSVGAVTFDPRSPNVLWVGAGPPLFGDTWNLVTSTDFGASWSAVPGWVAGGNIVAIDIDPADARKVVVARQGAGTSLWRTADGGISFAPIDAGLPSAATVRAVAVDWMTQPATVYAGTAAGVFAGTGSGTWIPLPGAAPVVANALQLARSPDVQERTTLVAATDEGIFEYTPDPGHRAVPVYRFYNRNLDAHFYTAVAAERAFVLAHYPQFADEGIAFWAFGEAGAGTIPAHRFFDTVRGTHAYTTDAEERDSMLAQTPVLAYEGIGFHVLATSEPGTVALYRFLHATNGATLYTASWDEALHVGTFEPRFVFAGRAIAVYPAAAGP